MQELFTAATTEVTLLKHDMILLTSNTVLIFQP